MSDKLQRTLVLLKPDAIHRGIVGEILHRFERVGVKMIGMKMLVSDKDTATKHYTEDITRRRGQKVRDMMIEMLTSGPTVAVVFEGIEVIEVVRKLVGTTEPKASAPGTIRGDFGTVLPYNVIHASDSPKSAKREITIFFRHSELVRR